MKMFYALGYEDENNAVKYFKVRLAKDTEVGIYFQKSDDSILEIFTKRDVKEIVKGIKLPCDLKLVPVVNASQRQMMREDLEVIINDTTIYTGIIIDKIAFGKKYESGYLF